MTGRPVLPLGRAHAGRGPAGSTSRPHRAHAVICGLVRTYLWAVLAVAACHPSATVESTMPIGNMQSYRSVALRVHSSAFAAQGQAMQLEGSVLSKLHDSCSFDQIAGAQARNADIVLDLNITNTGRGGGGFISNSSTARLDTLLVISDGQTGDLLGTARIHGESSGMIINNAPPELEAIDVVAKTVADMFKKSGCSGPRIARAVPPEPMPPPNPDHVDTTPAPDESHRAEAEKLDEDGKQKLFVADLQGALAAFQQADALVPDARYEYNICSALGLLERWDNAIAECQKARTMNPRPELVVKIDHKIELLQHHQ